MVAHRHEFEKIPSSDKVVEFGKVMIDDESMIMSVRYIVELLLYSISSINTVYFNLDHTKLTF